MKFKVVDWVAKRDRPETVYLTHTGWDDWFKFSTKYFVWYVDAHGTEHELGSLKIGQFGLKPARAGETKPGYRTPELKSSFSSIGEERFSLAQDSSFYETLTVIGAEVREAVLAGLREIAHDPGLLAQAEDEEVTRVSLLRSVPLLTVQEQFNRLAHGGSRLTKYDLSYKLNYTKAEKPPVIRIKVEPGLLPPTNIHVLVGRNGVGKSTFLNNLALHLVKRAAQGSSGSADSSNTESGSEISNLVSVSFSAFDAFEPLSVPQDRTKGLTYHYVGLKKRRTKKDDPESIKGPQALAREMAESVRLCYEEPLRSRWLRGLRLLEGDPIFRAAGIADLVDSSEDVQEVLDAISPMFGKKLSSGHKIVLLTITKLVETVQEKSLVLLDEPEAHLHPPLLSAFVRALGDLLINRNGVAIVATHSPVVLQEVPSSCVSIMRRAGDTTTVTPPRLETFGENVGTLTDEVFGLEVTLTGFHLLLSDAALRHRDYDSALEEFKGHLGAEGKAILRAMVNNISVDANVGG